MKKDNINYAMAVSGSKYTLMEDVEGRMHPLISGSAGEVKKFIEEQLGEVEVGNMGDGRRKRRTSVAKLATQFKRSGHVRIRKDLVEKLAEAAEFNLEEDVVLVERGAFYEVMKKEVA